MTYRGHIRDGMVVLDQPVALPEGATVEVNLRLADADAIHDASASTLANRFADVIGRCPSLPADMARNHNHYLHGQPKP